MLTGAAQTLSELETMRDTILARVVARIVRDERVVAAWLTGSIGRGEDDAWSDLDLHLAIADGHLDAWWSERESLYREVAPPLLVQREKPSNAQEGGRFQLVFFPGPVEVDWNVGPVSLATRPPTSRMLFARRDIPIRTSGTLDADARHDRLQRATEFFWAMAPIAVKYAGRGATTDAVDQIDLLKRGLTEAWQVVRGSANLDSPNPLVDPELASIVPALDPVIDPARCLEGIVAAMAAMTSLRPELETAGVAWPVEQVTQVEGIVEIARGIIEQDAGTTRQIQGH